MKMSDTRVEVAGVMRCCLATVATEYEGKDVELGMKSSCPHCHHGYTLVMKTPPKWWTNNKPYPCWMPDWQLEANKPPASNKEDGDE